MHRWLYCVVAVALFVNRSLQHDGPHHRPDDSNRGITGGIGSVATAVDLDFGVDQGAGGIAVVDPGFSVGKGNQGSLLGGQDFGTGSVGAYDGYIDGNNGFVNNRGGGIVVGGSQRYFDDGGQGFVNGGSGFMQGDSVGFMSAGDSFGSSGGFMDNSGSGRVDIMPSGGGLMDNSGSGTVSMMSNGIGSVGGVYENRNNVGFDSVGGEYFGRESGLASGALTDSQFVDFGQRAQQGPAGFYDSGIGGNGFMNKGAGSVDNGLGVEFIGAGGINRQGSIANDGFIGDSSYMRDGQDFRLNGVNGVSVGGTNGGGGYDGAKLQGFTDIRNVGVGGSSVLNDASMQGGGVAAVGSHDRVVGVKPGYTKHQSKITTVVKPIVRPVIRPIVRPVIQRVIRPIIQRPVVRRVVRPIYRPVINRVVRPIIRRPIINRIVRPIIRRIVRPIIRRVGRPDTGSAGIGGTDGRYPYPDIGKGGIGSSMQRPKYHKPSYRRTKYY